MTVEKTLTRNNEDLPLKQQEEEQTKERFVYGAR